MENKVIFYFDDRGRVFTNLRLCVVRHLEWWSWSPKFGTDECVLGLLVGLGIAGGEHGITARAGARMQQGGYTPRTGVWQHSQVL